MGEAGYEIDVWQAGMACDKFLGKQNYLEFVAKGLAEAREFRKSKKGEPRERMG